MDIPASAFGLSLLLITSAGCGPSSEEFRTLQNEVEASRASLQARLEALADSVEENSSQLGVDRIMRRIYTTVTLMPGDDAFRWLQTGGGTVSLAVVLEDVDEYASGATITLRFGNPTSATLDQPSFELEYGEVRYDERFQMDLANYETARQKSVTLSERLAPGAWTTARINLDGVPSSKLGFVKISSFDFSSLSLRR